MDADKAQRGSFGGTGENPDTVDHWRIIQGMSFLGPVGHHGIVVGGRRRRQQQRRLRSADNGRAFTPSAAGPPLGFHRHRYVHPSFPCRMTIASEPLSAAPGVKADTAHVSALFPERFRPFLTELDDGSVASRDVPQFHARRTKIVCTIGPATASYAELLKMAALGMNVVRLNMSHGDYTFHSEVIAHVRRINTESPFVLATMLDIGSLDSVRLGQMPGNEMALSPGDRLIITTRHQAEYPDMMTEVSDDAFMAVVQSGDVIEVRGNADGSVVLLRVAEVTADGTDADCVVMEGGTIRSRAPIGVRGKSLRSPILNAEEMERDLDFAVQERVEAVALSFVEAPEHIWDVKRQLKERGASNTAVVAKIESVAALERLSDIAEAADAVMIARGDLGAAVRYDMVPYWQQRIAQMCRAHGKPCIVSTHFLESMVSAWTPDAHHRDRQRQVSAASAVADEHSGAAGGGQTGRRLPTGGAATAAGVASTMGARHQSGGGAGVLVGHDNRRTAERRRHYLLHAARLYGQPAGALSTALPHIRVHQQRHCAQQDERAVWRAAVPHPLRWRSGGDRAARHR
eukprot:ctg_63.g13